MSSLKKKGIFGNWIRKFLSDGGRLSPLQAAGNELAPGAGVNLLSDRRFVRTGGDSTVKAQAVGAQVLQFLPV